MMNILTQWYENKKIKPKIDQILPMSELMNAYERMNARAVQGKLVLVNPT
jgi:NADPH2:quinone reductase